MEKCPLEAYLADLSLVLEGKDDPPCLESSSCGCVLPESSRGEASSSKKDAETTSGDSSSESCDGEEERLSVTNLYRLMTQGANPRDVLKRMLDIPERDLSMLEECTDRDVWRLLFETVSRRQKLRQYNTLADAVDLIEKSNKIVVLTGAGVRHCGLMYSTGAEGVLYHLKVCVRIKSDGFFGASTQLCFTVGAKIAVPPRWVG